MPKAKVLAIAVENGETLKKLGEVLGLDLSNVQTVGSVDGLKALTGEPEAPPIEIGDEIKRTEDEEGVYITLHTAGKQADEIDVEVFPDSGVVVKCQKEEVASFGPSDFGHEIDFLRTTAKFDNDGDVKLTLPKVETPVLIRVQPAY